jgi:hypothetical protein
MLKVLFTIQLCSALRLSQPVVPAGPPVAMAKPGSVNPVTKIVKLLQDMATKLAAEQAKDEEVYEKFACWCETTTKDKQEPIAQAEVARGEIESAIEEHAANVAKLETEIAQLKDERVANKKAIQTATELRDTERAEFEASAGEMKDTMDAIAQALSVLKKGTGLTALLQQKVHSQLAKSKKEIPSVVLSWLQSAGKQPAGFKSYNSRSGQIVGILAQMGDDFAADLKQAQEQEAAAQASYEKLVAAKEEQIKIATERILKLTQQKTDAEVALVQAKKDLKDLIKQVAGDNKVLADAMERCPKMEDEYAQRQKERSVEIAGVNDALQILTDDNARDLFSSSFSFLQVSTKAVRTQAANVLKKAAAANKDKARSTALSALAAKVQLDAFTKVKAYIDEMYAALKQEQADEVEHQRWCTKELRANAVATKEKKWEEEDLGKKVNDLAAQLEQLDDDLLKLRDQEAEALRTIKHAGEDREAENAEFKQVVADQRGAVMILTKVLERLQQVYAPDVLASKKQAAAVEADNAAKAERANMTPGAAKSGIRVTDDQQAVPQLGLAQQPKGFGGPMKKQASGGVLGLIEETSGAAQRLVDAAIHEEQEQQAAYESLTRDMSGDLAANRQ